MEGLNLVQQTTVAYWFFFDVWKYNLYLMGLHEGMEQEDAYEMAKYHG